ncbi:MAG: I78 family peptidase inhibitor [Sphingomicrobium sp.]
MRSGLLLLPIMLAACSTAPAEPPVHGADPGHVCHSEGLGRFLGQPATPDLGAQMLAVSGARSIRWVPFGAMITMDYSPSRLTVRLDQQNRVASATCG